MVLKITTIMLYTLASIMKLYNLQQCDLCVYKRIVLLAILSLTHNILCNEHGMIVKLKGHS